MDLLFAYFRLAGFFIFELNCQACVIILVITGQGCLVFRFWILVACNCLILWRGLRYKFMQTIWFLYAKHMQAREVYEFYMHEHNLFLNIIVELRRNTVEIVLDFLCKKYTLGINLVYCAANSDFQCGTEVQNIQILRHSSSISSSPRATK